MLFGCSFCFLGQTRSWWLISQFCMTFWQKQILRLYHQAATNKPITSSCKGSLPQEQVWSTKSQSKRRLIYPSIFSTTHTNLFWESHAPFPPHLLTRLKCHLGAILTFRWSNGHYRQTGSHWKGFSTKGAWSRAQFMSQRQPILGLVWNLMSPCYAHLHGASTCMLDIMLAY